MGGCSSCAGESLLTVPGTTLPQLWVNICRSYRFPQPSWPQRPYVQIRDCREGKEEWILTSLAALIASIVIIISYGYQC